MQRLLSLLTVLVFLVSLDSFAQQKDPLRILSTFPKGQLEGTNQARAIIVTFSKPVVPLQQLPEGDGTGPMVITPAVKGKFRWLGTSTLSFTPADTLELATEYSVRIPANVKASDGSTLPSDVAWTFTTPRPALTASYPGHNQQSVDLAPTIFLRFTQKMNPSKAASFITMKEGTRDGRTVPITLSVPTNEELSKARVYWSSDTTMMLAIRLQKSLAKNKRYVVMLAKGLPGARGPLGMGKEASFAFDTYRDFVFGGLDNTTNRRPNDALIFHFSTPVSFKELAKNLVFSPPVKMPENYGEYEWSAPELSFYLQLKAETKYICTIKKELSDVFGQTLGKDVEITLTTTSHDPYLTMTSGHGILEAYGERMYPVTTMNLSSLEVKMLRLNRDNVIPTLSSTTPEFLPYEISKEWQNDSKRNVEKISGLALDEALGEGKHGAVLVEVGSNRVQTRIRADVQVTELGLTAKFSPDDMLLWVTTLKEGLPVAGASVELRNDSNRVLWQSSTDKDGFVKGAGWGKFGLAPKEYWSRPQLWVIVSKGDDLAYTCSDWQQGIEPYRFNIMYDWNPEFEPWQGRIFTDRGIYRTGERVEFKGILRNRSGGDWVIRSADVYVRVYDSQNEQLMVDSVQLNEFGSFASSFIIPTEGHLGYYRIEVSLKKKKVSNEQLQAIASESFRVEAYRPSEFEVTARMSDKSCVVGDRVKGSIEAKYLFGGVMKGERVRWRMRFEPSSFAPEDWEGYWFGRNVWSYGDATGPQSKLLFSKDTVLNVEGRLDVEAQTEVGDIRSSGSITLEGEVTSPSRQTVSGRAGLTIHGGEFYIGIMPSSTFTAKDSSLVYKIVTVTPEGKAIEGKKVEVKILKREWHSVRKSSAEGGFEWQSEVVDSLLATSQVISSLDPIEQSHIPRQSGLYIIETKCRDARGNEITTDTYFYASGSDYVAWERTDDDHIELIADKKEYKPGQTARIIVKNPYEEATAMISVEREGIRQHWRATLKGSAPEIKVQLDEHSLPNVFVSVVLVQGRMTKKPDLDQLTDVGRPSFKIGYAQLNVDPGTRHLKLTTSSDKQTYRPGDEVTVNVAVRDANGTPAQAEVTISIADKGVLNLIGYTLPDPFELFYGPRPLAVSTTESRAQIVLARSFGEKGEEEGGGGGMDLGGVATRGNFKYTAYWNPVLRTDSTGNLTVKFKLPDNLTTFKIMAVAQSKKSEFGYAENSFTVNKPLLLQASLPRFARVGDTFEAGVVVHNYSAASGTVSLKTSGKGIQFKGKEIVEFKLGAGESKEIRHQFEGQHVGKATFTFQAAMQKETDGLTVSIPIQVPRQREVVAQYDAVQASLESKLIVPKDTYSDLGSIEFTAASTALTGLENGVEYLFSYPYGCIEQKASRVLPIILGRQMVEAFGFEALKGKDAKAVVASTLREFKNYQTYSGGFSYWPGDGRDAPYASAFVMYVLVQAKRNGYAVNEAMFASGVDYIKGVLRFQDNMPNYPYGYNAWAGTKTLILYTLALLKRPEPAYYETYFKNLDRIPLFAKVNLLKSVQASTKNKKMVQSITSNLLNNIKVNPTSAHFEEPNIKGLEWCWNSDVRTTAIILQALLETNGFPGDKADYPAKIVKWLMQQQKSGRWENTQENVYVVDALATYFKKYESEEPKFKAEISVAGKSILSKMFEGRSLKIEKTAQTLDKFEQGTELALQSKKEGAGILYVGVRMAYYPKADDLMRDEGIAVLKTMEPLTQTDKKWDGKTFAPGTIVKVTLRVITPQQRNFVVVDDPLPAGLEAVNTSLQTESTELAQALSSIQSEERSYRWWGSFNHHEMKDDRVLVFADELDTGVHTFTYLARATTFGKFMMPSTHTEMMYEPEVFGQTAGGQVEIK